MDQTAIHFKRKKLQFVLFHNKGKRLTMHPESVCTSPRKLIFFSIEFSYSPNISDFPQSFILNVIFCANIHIFFYYWCKNKSFKKQLLRNIYSKVR